jgi:hypothetical protein
MQGLSFAQTHLFRSHHVSIEGLERCGGCDLNNILFNNLSKAIGYSGLAGETEDQILRGRIHEEHGAVPTLIVARPEQIATPNPEVQRILDLANSV